MRHRVSGKKLGRTTAHRQALLRNLSTQLFEKERITTTLMKAKELRPFAEKLVTLAKRETLQARRQVLRQIHDRTVVAKLFDALSARYAQRPGGYTRIIKLGPRRGDHAELAMIELVGAEEAKAEQAPAAEKTKKKAKPKKKTAAAPAKGAKASKTKKKTTKKKKTAKAEGGRKKASTGASKKKKTTKKKTGKTKASKGKAKG